jgi:hypothetical protein
MKEWTLEEAIDAHHRARAAGMEWFDPAGPLSQWHALQELETLERQYAAGDRFALLHAIRVCANHDLVIPLRAALAYIRCFDAVLTCRTDAWDDAFGRPYPPGMHIAKARQRRQLRFQIYNRVQAILRSERTPIDEALFERVGDEFDIGKTLCNKLYYQAKKLSEMTFPSDS